MFAQIDVLITRYVGETTGLPPDEARVLQKQFYQQYGTSLRGLMEGYGVDPDTYLKAVHDIDYSCVLPHPALMAAIAALPGRKFVFTNADLGHANAVLSRLGGADLFDGRGSTSRMRRSCPSRRGPPTRPSLHASASIRPAPPCSRTSKRTCLCRTKWAWRRCMSCRARTMSPVDRDDWELSRADGYTHIHHVTDDLAAFLTAV